MEYSIARNYIQNGDILLFRGNRFYSRLIKARTQSVYSHVGIAHWIQSDGVKRLAVCESMEGRGVQIYPLRRYVEQGVDIDWYAITDETINRDKVVAWAMQRWGNDYASAWQMLRSFGFVSKRIFEWMGIPTKIDKDRYFCSWFAASALKHGGWQPSEADGVVPELASPGDISMFPCLQRRRRLEAG